MGIYLKKFSAHTDYEAAKSSLMPPNVSFCVSGPRGVHYKDYCRPSTVYELVGNPSYPTTIQYDVTSFDINFNYKKTVTTSDCQKTVTNSADTVTVNCSENTGSSDRTVSGTVTWNGINIEYSLIQKSESNTCLLMHFDDSSDVFKDYYGHTFTQSEHPVQ